MKTTYHYSVEHAVLHRYKVIRDDYNFPINVEEVNEKDECIFSCYGIGDWSDTIYEAYEKYIASIDRSIKILLSQKNEAIAAMKQKELI